MEKPSKLIFDAYILYKNNDDKHSFTNYYGKLHQFTYILTFYVIKLLSRVIRSYTKTFSSTNCYVCESFNDGAANYFVSFIRCQFIYSGKIVRFTFLNLFEAMWDNLFVDHVILAFEFDAI